MDKTTINLVNSNAISEYIKRFCYSDPRLELLLTTALVKLIKNSPEFMEVVPTLPDSAPPWLTQAWSSQPQWYQFKPNRNIRLASSILKTLEWIQQAIDHDIAWLRNVDKQGRPRKLLNITSFEQIDNCFAEDTKFLIHETRRKSREILKNEDIGQEIISYIEFTDGFRIVMLLTERALDRESAFLEHCIGDGDYDECLKNGVLLYFSLRDAENIPCATITIDPATQNVHYIASKRNKLPDSKYIPYIASLCSVMNINMTHFFSKNEEEYSINHISSHYIPQTAPAPVPEHNYLDFYDLHEEIVIEDELSIARLSISNIGCLKQFPKNLQVTENVYLYGKKFPEEPPQGWVVMGKITTSIDSFHCVEDFIAKYYPLHAR